MSKLKLYTKTGDDGTTGLLSGKRVKKNNIRIQTYGTLDELNVWIGMIRNVKTDQNTQNTLLIIQKEIMTIASQLADDTNPRKSNLVDILDPIDEGNIKFLEKQIDLISNSTPDLKNFIIPGGHKLISFIHVARCTCRKAERFIASLKEKEIVPRLIVAYINRLSDYLFALSRKLAYDLDVSEIKWIPKKKQ